MNLLYVVLPIIVAVIVGLGKNVVDVVIKHVAEKQYLSSSNPRDKLSYVARRKNSVYDMNSRLRRKGEDFISFMKPTETAELFRYIKHEE